VTLELDEEKMENTPSVMFVDPAHRFLFEEIKKLEKTLLEIKKKQEEKNR